jgi:hypothetical protein
MRTKAAPSWVRRFALTPSYARHWDVEKATCELVCNALDERNDATVRWSQGRLVIQDLGSGFGPASWVQGSTTKADDPTVVGRFGEGLVVGSLCLVREGVAVTVETVHEGERARYVPGIVFDERWGLDVLEVRCDASRLRRGTRITVGVSEEVATAVRSRFLHLRGGYTAPKAPGRIVRGRPGGELYLGGVLVDKGSASHFSYDMALDFKASTNRDRTMVEQRVRERAISGIVSECTDADALESLVRAAQRGACDAVELDIRPGLSEEARAAQREVGRRLFGKGRVALAEEGASELALVARDRGIRLLVPSGRHAYALRRLYEECLGVPRLRDAVAADCDGERTHWIEEWDLRAREVRTLQRGVALMRARYGEEVLGRVRVYLWTGGSSGCDEVGWLGFYDPRNDVTGVKRTELRSMRRLLGVLVHEAAHRKARSAGGEWYDRSRGFELALGEMAVTALTRRTPRADRREAARAA